MKQLFEPMVVVNIREKHPDGWVGSLTYCNERGVSSVTYGIHQYGQIPLAKELDNARTGLSVNISKDIHVGRHQLEIFSED